MEKVYQTTAAINAESSNQAQLAEIEVLALEQLEFVAGSDDGSTELPGKGWNTPQ